MVQWKNLFLWQKGNKDTEHNTESGKQVEENRLEAGGSYDRGYVVRPYGYAHTGQGYATYANTPRGYSPYTNAPQQYANSPQPYANAPNPYANAPNPYANAPYPYANSPQPYANAPNPYANAPNPYANAPYPYANAPMPYANASSPHANTIVICGQCNNLAVNCICGHCKIQRTGNIAQPHQPQQIVVQATPVNALVVSTPPSKSSTPTLVSAKSVQQLKEIESNESLMPTHSAENKPSNTNIETNKTGQRARIDNQAPKAANGDVQQQNVDNRQANAQIRRKRCGCC